jgi:hypothetical protein
LPLKLVGRDFSEFPCEPFGRGNFEIGNSWGNFVLRVLYYGESM